MEQPALTDEDFRTLRELVMTYAGIALNDGKRSLVQARLGRRLRHLGLRDYRAYCEYLMRHDPLAVERTAFINALTTNVTAFFRELHHFAYLKQVWLPAWRARAPRSGGCLSVWSAGCATGEEAYSIAMTVLESLPGARPATVRIIASDIDTDALARAHDACYARAEIASLPVSIRRGYFERAGGGLVRVAPRARELVRFARINLLDQAWPVPVRVDVIFCRNVLIYFDRAARQRVVQRLESRLRPHGLLLLGHSEGLLGTGTHLRSVGPTMYERPDEDAEHTRVATP